MRGGEDDLDLEQRESKEEKKDMEMEHRAKEKSSNMESTKKKDGKDKDHAKIQERGILSGGKNSNYWYGIISKRMHGEINDSKSKNNNKSLYNRAWEIYCDTIVNPVNGIAHPVFL